MFVEKFMRKLYLQRLIRHGLHVGKNLNMERGVNIDASFPWLVHIGDDCDLAAWTYILAHDASTKYYTGKTRIGNVYIGNRVFVGARTVILPNVTIGDNVVIGANSVVSKDIPSNVVAVGSPARPIRTIDAFEKTWQDKRNSGNYPVYDSTWTMAGGISQQQKLQMETDLENRGGFID